MAPYAGLKFASYEALKGVAGSVFGLEESQLRPWQRVTAGALAGLLAQTAVYPLDVVRRRMQTHEGRGALYSSPFNALATIAREEGITKGLYRGLTLNWIKTLCAPPVPPEPRRRCPRACPVPPPRVACPRRARTRAAPTSAST